MKSYIFGLNCEGPWVFSHLLRDLKLFLKKTFLLRKISLHMSPKSRRVRAKQQLLHLLRGPL